MPFPDANGQQANDRPGNQSPPINPSRTEASLPHSAIVPRSHHAFSRSGLDSLLRLPTLDLSHPLYPPNGMTMELPSLAGPWARPPVWTLSELAASLSQTTPLPSVMPRHDLLQQQLLQLLLRTQHPSAPVALPMPGTNVTSADVAYLVELLRQRNAVVLSSMESTQRLQLQLQQHWPQALLPMAPDVVVPAVPSATLALPQPHTTAFDRLVRDIPLALPVCLGRPEDAHKLTEYQAFLRQQIEVFAATEEDTDTHMRGRNKPVTLGQVGLRCRHCARVPVRFRQRGSTYFPSAKYGLYQAAQNMATAHIPACAEMPDAVAEELLRLRETSTAGAGRQYWVDSATQLGLVDTEAAGMRFIRDWGGGSALT